MDWMLKALLKPIILFSSTKSSPVYMLRECSMTQCKVHRDKWEIFFRMYHQYAPKHWSRFTTHCFQGPSGKQICMAGEWTHCGLVYSTEIRLSKPHNKYTTHTQKNELLYRHHYTIFLNTSLYIGIFYHNKLSTRLHFPHSLLMWLLQQEFFIS